MDPWPRLGIIIFNADASFEALKVPDACRLSKDLVEIYSGDAGTRYFILSLYISAPPTLHRRWVEGIEKSHLHVVLLITFSKNSRRNAGESSRIILFDSQSDIQQRAYGNLSAAVRYLVCRCAGKVPTFCSFFFPGGAPRNRDRTPEFGLVR
jgi:hypothetical protein